MFFNVELEEEIVALDEINVLPGENPANILFRKILSHKDQNNPANFPSWQSRIYAKTEIDVKNVNGSLRNKKLLSQFNFVFDYIDSLEMEGKTFLPVFFNETVSNFYHDKEKGKDREEIFANQASGMTVDMFSQFTGKMYENINIYDNYIMVCRYWFCFTAEWPGTSVLPFLPARQHRGRQPENIRNVVPSETSAGTYF